ncbi:MAG: pirin family protein [Acidobacteria bacterium]|nr:pirin family protein [Acidobacteriota bacterium]
MITVRRSNERGHANHGWLDTHHTFSFADYYDPRHMGFRSLRVINEDRVAPGKGFGTHGHRDMEILSYVLEGKLAHRDSMGHVELLGPNEIQRMSAGSGVRHSEFNGGNGEPVHFLQIWIEPATPGGPSSYEQIRFDPADKRGKWKLLAGPDGGKDAATINQDASVSVAELGPGEAISYELSPGRHAWLHVIRGSVTANGVQLGAGDAISASGESRIDVTAAEPGEVLLFDLD